MEKAAMSVQEMASHLGISLPKAYELTRQDGFPTIRIGARIIIPLEAFKGWLKEKANRNHVADVAGIYSCS